MTTPTVMFIIWLVGMFMGGVPAWIIAKLSLPKNWFWHLSFARAGTPIITAYPVKPNQEAITVKEGKRKLRFPLFDGYGAPFAYKDKPHRGTVYMGHAQAGGPIALRGTKMQRAVNGDVEDGQMVEWDWKVEPIRPSAAEMAAAQDDDREVKMVQASRKAAGGGIPMMYVLIGVGLLAMMMFMR